MSSVQHFSHDPSEPGSQTNPNLPGTVLLLGVASLFNDISGEMIAPVLVVFVTSLADHQHLIGVRAECPTETSE